MTLPSPHQRTRLPHTGVELYPILLAGREVPGARRRRPPRLLGIRLSNGRAEQTRTALLPNPFLTDTQQLGDTPDFNRLAAGDALRGHSLGLDADPLDRHGRDSGTSEAPGAGPGRVQGAGRISR
ncbi:DUF7676 family protein [Streptomyces sp. BBFR102]|uniref:DUF7676 family protein n=1 Tax=Streptomyces sp. BBFR102 TaxID=3448171 RepID=UPI003F531ABA